jgi:L-ascorbate metabolism protein UlaG (beta-lactamase superfamily)
MDYFSLADMRRPGINICVKSFIKVIGIALPFSVIILAGCFTSFGINPDGARLTRIQSSPYYRDGAFQNIESPPPSDGIGFAGVIKMRIFDADPRRSPAKALPSVKTDLSSIPPDANVLIWLGHSSYYIQMEGKKFLIDPVLSGSAFVVSAFDGSDVYAADEIPAIDYLVITHDHWDHLDYDTVTSIKPRTVKVLTGLGAGSHLVHWGFTPESIVEFEWNETAQYEGITVTAVPSRHFSGRSLSRNNTLWTSFVIATSKRKIFVCGDSGYGAHFKAIGEEHGPFDLALLECGQYNARWKTNHMFPEETAQASVDLRARKMFPGHWGKFALSIHAWDEPIRRLVSEAGRRDMMSKEERISVVHPMLGEMVNLDADTQFARWWEAID